MSIPLITDPLGRGWIQPERDRIEIDKTHALMELKDLRNLYDYSRSNPSAVYEGKMWGNGAAFDNAILANAYRAAGIKQPWELWNDRCYRTICAYYPGCPRNQPGTPHNALDDARSQAEHLSFIAPWAIV